MAKAKQTKQIEASGNNTGKAYSKEEIQNLIRQKALELYNKRGHVYGNDWADWFEAENIVKQELHIS